ncbi:MAG: hypothetical protein HKN09_09085 [Saprospiraceae bacterium]|nr:hypothetical protein [Saprospiraceae bacterium]
MYPLDTLIKNTRLFLLIFISIQINAQTETKITASDGAMEDRFGFEVGISGDRAVVGAYQDDDDGSSSGSAYIYEWDGNSWIETKLTASDAEAGDRFGESVSIDGNRVIVGAGYDGDNGFFSGSIYIYEWDGSSWVETKITPSDGAFSDLFGRSVSIDGNRAIVGSEFDDDNGSNSGSAYIFEWDGNGWLETKITASDGVSNDVFGEPVSINGDRAIIGAVGDDDNGSNSGSAYIYEWDGSSWVETKLTASDGATGDKFGRSVSIDGNRAIIGSNFDDDNGSNSGSAYIYEWDGSSWVETKITAFDGAESDLYGSSVSINGDRAIVGNAGDDDNGSSSGSVYIYEWDGSSWLETKIVASDADVGDNYGAAVSVDGDRTVVGSYRDDDNGSDSGSIYIYDFCPEVINTFQDAGSGLWLDASNWSLNEVPAKCHNVIIPNGQMALIQNGELAECFTLDVQPGGLFEVIQGGKLDVMIED